MTEPQVQVLGLASALADLARVSEKIGKGAEIVARETTDRLGSLVASQVPRQSGNLAASVDSLVVEGGSAVGYDTGQAPYAGWIDFGGGRGRPYVPQGRFLFRSAALAEPIFQASAERAAEAEIRRMSWSKA